MSSSSLPSGWNADEMAGARWPCWARRWKPAWKLEEPQDRRRLQPTLCSHSSLGLFTLMSQLHKQEIHPYFLSGLFL